MTQNPPIRNKEALARVKTLTRVYASAAREMERTLRDAALTDAARWRMEQHLSQVRAIIDALNGAVAAQVPGIVGPMYQEGVDLARRALQEGGVRMTGWGLDTGVNTGAMQAISDQMTQDLLVANGGLENAARRLLTRTQQVKTEERAINELVARGVVEGQTRGQLARNLREQIVQDLNGAAKVTAGGRRYDPGYYATMVSATRMREAATAGVITTSVEVGVTLFKVSIHEGACEDCQKWQGKVFSLGGGDKRFPELKRRPPFHPNCEHVLLPFVEERYTDRELASVARVSNDPGYITSTSDWEAARKGAKLPDKPRDFEGERAARRKGRRVTVSKPTAPAPPPAKAKPKAAKTAAKDPVSQWKAQREAARAASTPTGRKDAERRVSEMLARGAQAKYRRGLLTNDAAHRQAMKTDIRFPKSIPDDRAMDMCATLGELEAEAERLGIPPIRGMQFQARGCTMDMDNFGVLGVSPSNLERAARSADEKGPVSSILSARFPAKDRTRVNMYHEFGHHVHFQRQEKDGFMDRLGSAWKGSDKGKSSASHYAGYNEQEWFAENYGAAMMDRWDLVDPNPDLRALLREVIPT